jgi:hypothetical protein
MSERAVAFVEGWIADNIASEAFLESGSNPRARQLAQAAIGAAELAGIATSEIVEEFPDLTLKVTRAIEAAADAKVRHQIDNDD